MIALIVIVGLTLVAIAWRVALRRESSGDRVTHAWRAEHYRERRDD